MTQLLATNSQTRSFGRSHANTRAISLPSSTPFAFDFWMVAETPVREANWPSSVGASVSSTVTSSVALATRSSPFAARCPSSVASVKPPAHAAIVFTLVRAGDLAGDGDRLFAGRQVGLHVPVALRGGRIAPADAERLDALLNRVLGEAAARRQVGGVELVDLRRHDDQRPLVHALGLRRVLDELESLAAVHHGAGRHREILADLELALVDLARHAEIVGEIVDEILQAVEQALAARLGDPLQRARIAEQRIRRRESFGEQLQHEARALAVVGGGVGAIEHAIQHVAPGDEALHEPLVVAALLPDDVAEAAVARDRQRSSKCPSRSRASSRANARFSSMSTCGLMVMSRSSRLPAANNSSRSRPSSGLAPRICSAASVAAACSSSGCPALSAGAKPS